MKLVIAGSRSFDEQELRDLFDFTQLVPIACGEWPDEFIIGGCPTGVDAWAEYQADDYWDITPTTIMEADWDKYGKSAGPIRNKEMAQYGDALLLIWDGKSKGSANMKSNMEALGKPIYEIIIRRSE